MNDGNGRDYWKMRAETQDAINVVADEFRRALTEELEKFREVNCKQHEGRLDRIQDEIGASRYLTLVVVVAVVILGGDQIARLLF